MPRVVRLVLAVLACVAVLGGCHPKTTPPPPPEPTFAERMTAAKAALATADCTKARPQLDAAVRLDPQATEAQLLLGICAYKLGDAKAGEAALSRVMVLDPASPLPYEAQGLALYGLERRAEARQALETALAKGSQDPRILYYLANLSMFAGDCRAAFDMYRRAIVLDPSFLPAQTEFETARRACAKGIAPKPAAAETAPK